MSRRSKYYHSLQHSGWARFKGQLPKLIGMTFLAYLGFVIMRPNRSVIQTIDDPSGRAKVLLVRTTYQARPWLEVKVKRADGWQRVFMEPETTNVWAKLNPRLVHTNETLMLLVNGTNVWQHAELLRF